MMHEQAREVLTEYALGGLDATTSAQLADHLCACSACQQELGEEYRTLDALGRGVEQVRPRPELRARVIATVVGSTASDAPRPVTGRASLPPWGWGALAAAATLALATTGGWLDARRNLAELQTELTRWQVRVAQAEDRASQAADDATSQRRLVAVMTASDLQYVSLSGVAPATSARARAFVSASTGTLIFAAQGLPALPPKRVYQLWAIIDSTPVSAGVFEPDRQGRSQMVAQLAELAGPAAALAVTLEPEGGVPQPTGPKYLVGAPAN